MIIIDNFLYNHLLTCRDKIWSKKLWVLPAYCYLPCRHVAYPLAHPAVQHRTGVEVLLLLLYDTAQGQQADNNLQCGLLHSYMLFTSCRATSGKNNDALIEKKSNHISKLWSRFYLCLCSGLLNPCGSRTVAPAREKMWRRTRARASVAEPIIFDGAKAG